MVIKKLVEYRRVSTHKQGMDGLGMDAQQTAVKNYALSIGGKIVQTFVEVETGKRSDRPQLAKALAACKALGATLICAKLDRLSRNVAFLSALMESGVDFVACDNPTANRLTLHILAAVAENEAKMISDRTRAALAAYKARGGLLGGQLEQCKNNLTTEARIKGNKNSSVALKANADEFYAHIFPIITDLRNNGKTLNEIAINLNEVGYTTQRGNPFSIMQVKLCLDRAARVGGQNV